MKTTPTFHVAAVFSDSWNVPMLRRPVAEERQRDAVEALSFAE